MSIIKLKAENGEIFSVDAEVAKCSTVINIMVEDLATGEEEEPIPLQISAPILTKVIQWCTHHKDDPEVPENAYGEQAYMSNWDIEFINVDNATLGGLLNAANYLDIKGLLTLTATAAAKIINGGTAAAE